MIARRPSCPKKRGGQEDRVATPQQPGEGKQKLILAKRTISLEDPVLEGVKTSGSIRPHTLILPPRREGLRSRAILERTRNRQFDKDFVTDSDDDQYKKKKKKRVANDLF